MMARLMVATVAFGGDYGNPNDPDTDLLLDADMAYADLRRAGFEVLRLPDHYRRHLYHPLDDFFEVRWVGSDDPEVVNPIWDQIEAIVAPMPVTPTSVVRWSQATCRSRTCSGARQEAASRGQRIIGPE
jgi:hypothetical protein